MEKGPRMYVEDSQASMMQSGLRWVVAYVLDGRQICKTSVVLKVEVTQGRS